MGSVLRSAVRMAARFGLLLSVCVLAVCVPVSRGEAQAPRDAAEEQARAHFNTGTVAFGAGRYGDALVEFQKAYALSQRPKLLYNIGVASDRLRHDGDALAAFEQYLQRVPDAPERAEVEARIAVLRGVVNAPAPPPSNASDVGARLIAPTAAPPVEPTVSPDAIEPDHTDAQSTASSAHPSVAQWLVLGASGVMAVTGGVLLTVAMLDKSAVESPSDAVRLNEIESAHDRVPLFSTLGGVFLGAGLVGVGLATTWILLSDDEAAVEAQVGLGRVSLRGSF